MVIDGAVMEGIIQHRNVHATTNSNKCVTSLPVYSERLHLVGTLDALEQSADGLIVIEHKHGSAKAWENDQVQVAAQAMAFEEMTGQTISYGSVFSWTTRRRYQFSITPELRTLVEQSTEGMRAVLRSGQRPRPTEESHKCKGCSLREVCQPALIRKMRKGK